MISGQKRRQIRWKLILERTVAGLFYLTWALMGLGRQFLPEKEGYSEDLVDCRL